MDMKESLGPAAVFPLGEENETYAQYFVGTSYLASLTGTDAGVSVSNVTFEPGCRNNWHVHHVGGQILLVTGGRGYCQEWPARARAQAGRCGEHPARNEALARGGAGQLVLARGHRRASRRRVERVAGARLG